MNSNNIVIYNNIAAEIVVSGLTQGAVYETDLYMFAWVISRNK